MKQPEKDTMRRKKMDEKKAEKILFVTYNDINGFPIGLYEDKKIIALSGEYGASEFAALGKIITSKEDRAFLREVVREARTSVLAELDKDMNKLLDRISIAYVYCGAGGLDMVKNMIDRMKSKGIEAKLVGCRHHVEDKINTANELGIEFILSECGGNRTLGRIAGQYRNTE